CRPGAESARARPDSRRARAEAADAGSAQDRAAEARERPRAQAGEGGQALMIAKLLAGIRSALSLLVILPVRFYQVVIGPLLPKVCIYHPSCSEYFILAVRKYGPVRRSWKALRRLCRSHPFHRGAHH